MTSKKPNNTLPPYISGREFNYFLYTLGNGVPTEIDEAWLVQAGITSGNAPSLLSALRWLRLLDHFGRTNQELLGDLSDEQKRPNAFRRILESVNPYPDLMKRNLKDLTVERATDYFSRLGVIRGTDTKCARFFFYMATQAGYRLGEEILLPPDRRLLDPVPRATDKHIDEAPSEPLLPNATTKSDNLRAIRVLTNVVSRIPERLTVDTLRVAREIIEKTDERAVIDEAYKLKEAAWGVAEDAPELVTPEVFTELWGLIEAINNRR